MGEAVARLAAELKALHQAAGGPSYRQLVGLAQRQSPPVRLAVATLSGWLCGQTIPSDARAFRWLVEVLDQQARRRAGETDNRPCDWRRWEQLRQHALAQRRKERPVRGESASTTKPDEQRESAPVGVDHDDTRAAPVVPVARRGRRLVRRAATVVAAAALVATGFVAARMTAGSAPPAQAAGVGQSTASLVIIGSDHKNQVAEPLPGPNRWFVAHDVQGPDDCPDGWACFFQNEQFNTLSAGWMILAQDEEKVYNLTGQYDKAFSSWINRTPVDIGWHEQPNAWGSWHGMEPGQRRATMGAEARTGSSVHIFVDDRAFAPGSKP
jgi:hypothetical protein